MGAIYQPGTGNYRYEAADYAKVQKAKNPDYYTPVGSGGTYPTHVHYKTATTNNGQETHHTHTTLSTASDMRPGVTATYTNGYDEGTAGWKATDTNTASNYAMTHGAAAKYNG